MRPLLTDFALKRFFEEAKRAAGSTPSLSLQQTTLNSYTKRIPKLDGLYAILLFFKNFNPKTRS